MRTFTALLPALVLVSASSCGGDDVTDGGSGTDTGSGASGGSGVTDGAATDHGATAAIGGSTGGSSGSTEEHNGGAADESGTGGSGTGGEQSGDGGSNGNEGGGGGSGGSAAGAGGSSGASGGTGASGDGGGGGAAGDGGTGGTAAKRCDDGTDVRCKMLPPKCKPYEMLAVQKSCYACVNPATCVPWGEETRCKNDMQCEPTHYCDPCATSSCPMCDDCVTACVPHGCRTESTLTCRCARPECGNEGVAVIRDGCWICLSIESCAPTGTGVRC